MNITGKVEFVNLEDDLALWAEKIIMACEAERTSKLEELTEAGYSIKDTAELVVKIIEKGHDRRYAIAPDKIKEEVGWVPDTMFEEGIRLTIKWFFENEEWMKNVTSGDYVLCGDNQYRKEYGVQPEQILAALTGFYRGNQYIDCEKNKKYKQYVKLWCSPLFPRRCAVWAVKAVMKIRSRASKR